MRPAKDSVSEQRSIATTVALGAIVLLFAALSCVGITWGLPSRRIDPFLFGADEPWSGEKIHRLAHAAKKFAPDRGADVDADPLSKLSYEPIPLTATDEDVARIYLRYRLYTYQPDEMITMMALAGMRPGQLQLDPRLYQYGGLFIYPVGALIKLCGMLGLIDVRSDVVFYLDHPDEFGKFYIVARGYSAAWGALGVVLVFGIARRLRGDGVGLLAALLFALLPVVACMSHEGKPHLPGAVLMLAAVYFAMRWIAQAQENPPRPPLSKGGRRSGTLLDEGGRRRDASHAWAAMCVCCGAALGMVLSSWPIMVLIPLVAWITRVRSQLVGGVHPFDGKMVGGAHSTGVGRSVSDCDEEKRGPHSGPYDCGGSYVRRVVYGAAIAVMVYGITNPYVVLNLFVNRDVLRSNFGNSLAMYQVAQVGEGFLRVLQLTIEGATLPVVVLGGVACCAAAWRCHRMTLVLVIPAVVFFLQFVMIGAGKPAEYGRFGVFYEAALAIGAACCLVPRSQVRFGIRSGVRGAATLVILTWIAWFNGAYLWNLVIDVRGGSRLEAIRGLERSKASACEYAVVAEPAPYGCPPLPFDRCDVFLRRTADSEAEPSVPHPRSSEDGAPGANYSFRTVDAEVSVLPSLPRLRRDRAGEQLPWWTRFAESLWSDCDTPISWANKPIEFTTASERKLIRGGFRSQGP